MNLFAINRFIFKTGLNFKTLNLKIRTCANNRYYSNCYNIVPRPKDAFEQGEFEKYQSDFKVVVEYLTSFDKAAFPELNEYFNHILNYNVPGHEQTMGPLVVLAYKCFTPSEKQTNENNRLACILGWVIDMIANSFQILDDILDSSQTRVNKPCWYKNDSVQLKAIQHSGAIGDGAFMILNNFLADYPNLMPILKLTVYAKFRTSLAQTFDTMSESQTQFFTKETYRIATMYKGAYPAVIHPFRAGMYLAGVSDRKLHSEITPILEELGIYFTAQNDILDCYGKPEITGKYGSDVKVGKLTWLSAQAMTDAKPAQKELFQLHYGKSDLKSQKIIYDLYKELEILKKFLMYEKESYNQIRDMINSTSAAIPKKPLQRMVDAFYGKIERLTPLYADHCGTNLSDRKLKIAEKICVLYNRNWKIGVIFSAIYFPLVDAFWSLVTIGIFFSLIFAPRNIITSGLSYRIFVPFSKLAYGIYLVHNIPLLWIRLSKLDIIRRFSSVEVIYAGIADVISRIIIPFFC